MAGQHGGEAVEHKDDSKGGQDRQALYPTELGAAEDVMGPGRDGLVKPGHRNQGEHGDQEQTAQPQLENARHTGPRIVISDRAGFYRVILVKAWSAPRSVDRLQV